MSMKLRPLADHVIIEAIDKEETFAGGELVLPDTAKERPQQGTVLAVGEGRMDEEGNRTPMDVRVGDTVLFGKYAGTEIKIDGKEVLILEEGDILAVVK